MVDSLRTGFNTDRVTKAVLTKLAVVPMPPGYRLVPAGEIESRQESFGGIGSAVIVAVFAILAIHFLKGEVKLDWSGLASTTCGISAPRNGSCAVSTS